MEGRYEAGILVITLYYSFRICVEYQILVLTLWIMPAEWMYFRPLRIW